MTQPAQYISGRTVQEQMDQLIGYVDTRAAEVATDAIASDVAQVHQDMLDADADASAAAASAAAAAGTLANAVKKTGETSQSIAGDIAVAGALSGGSIATSGAATFSGTTTVPAPMNNTDAATKKYVDDHHDATKLNITDVNSYAVGLTGNQGPIAGNKTFSGSVTSQQLIQVSTNGNSPTLVVKYNIADNADSSTYYYPSIAFVDANDNRAARITATKQASGRCIVTVHVRNADGTYKAVDIAAGDP